MLGFGEDFKVFRIIVWHSINFTEGRIRLMPYLDVFKIKELKVDHIGFSSHYFINPGTTLSKFSTTYVLLRPAMVKCQESFYSTKRW